MLLLIFLMEAKGREHCVMGREDSGLVEILGEGVRLGLDRKKIRIAQYVNFFFFFFYTLLNHQTLFPSDVPLIFFES